MQYATPEKIFIRQLLRSIRRRDIPEDLSYLTVLKFARLGFSPIEVARYELDRNQLGSHYLSELDSLRLQERSRSPLDSIIHDKLTFHCALSAVSDLVCKFHGLIIRGNYLPWPIRDSSSHMLDHLRNLLTNTPLVLKPRFGSMKRGLTIVEEGPSGTVFVNKVREPRPIEEVIGRHSLSVVTEYAQQAAYAEAIAPGWSGPIRVLTVRNRDNRPVMVSASHQFSTRLSSTSPGDEQRSIRAGVDVLSGEMLAALGIGNRQRLVSYSSHPDTGSQIRGSQVPNWPRIRQDLELAHARLPLVESVSWDVVITDSGPRVLEAERALSPRLFQWHSPLLLNQTFVDFAVRHGVSSGQHDPRQSK